MWLLFSCKCDWMHACCTMYFDLCIRQVNDMLHVSHQRVRKLTPPTAHPGTNLSLSATANPTGHCCVLERVELTVNTLDDDNLMSTISLDHDHVACWLVVSTFLSRSLVNHCIARYVATHWSFLCSSSYQTWLGSLVAIGTASMKPRLHLTYPAEVTSEQPFWDHSGNTHWWRHNENRSFGNEYYSCYSRLCAVFRRTATYTKHIPSSCLGSHGRPPQISFFPQTFLIVVPWIVVHKHQILGSQNVHFEKTQKRGPVCCTEIMPRFVYLVLKQTLPCL